MTKRRKMADWKIFGQYKKTHLGKTIARIQWFFICLVILYLILHKHATLDNPLTLFFLGSYALLVLILHYTNPLDQIRRWQIAFETWLTVLFVSWLMWSTHETTGALITLYLFAIIISALVLNKATTFLQILAIICIYFYLNYLDGPDTFFSTTELLNDIFRLAPFLLIAYLTTLISENMQTTQSQLKKLSETDELTQLLNKRGFMAILQQEIFRSARYDRQFSLLLIDSDNLKAINDEYGHEAGDALIKHLATVLQSSLRLSDTLARYGGDEFIVLLIETNIDGAYHVAEELRSNVAKKALVYDKKSLELTVSIGISCYPHHDSVSEELISKADIAMYESKSKGKNCITPFSKKTTSILKAS